MYTFSASVWSTSSRTLVGYSNIQAETFAEAEQAAISLFHADHGEEHDCLVVSLQRYYEFW